MEQVFSRGQGGAHFSSHLREGSAYEDMKFRESLQGRTGRAQFLQAFYFQGKAAVIVRHYRHLLRETIRLWTHTGKLLLENRRGNGHIAIRVRIRKKKREKTMERIIKAIKAFFAALSGETAAPQHKQAPAPAPVPAKAGLGEFEAGAIYALALLQRDGRLVDFLQEDLSSCTDEQIGAAARQIHDTCAKVVKDRFGIAPVVSAEEGRPFHVPEPFDPSELKLTGNVPEGGSPGEGTLLHKGWKAAKINFPVRTVKARPEIICQAEVGF